MICNIMEEYMKYAQKEITSCIKLIMGSEFDKELSKAYLETYIQSRYFNFDVEEKQKIFYRRIYLALKKTSIKLLEQEKEKEGTIKHMLEMYQYIFYIDDVREIKDLKDFVNLIYEKRIKLFGTKPEPKFKNTLNKIIKDGKESKEKFLNAYDSDSFELNVNKYILIKDLYKVDLDYNFKIPYIYSQGAIDDVFNESVINEDKLIIKYALMTTKCIKEIISGDFKKKYTANLTMSLFKKKKKLNQLLKIINNQAILDKIKLKITYSDFIKYKTQIYELMKDGYKFVVVLDDKFKVNKDNIVKLNIFDFVIVSEKQKYYEELEQYSKILINKVIDND